MKNYKYFLIITLILSVTFHTKVFAAADTLSVKPVKDPTVIMKKISEVSKTINTIECDFIQKKHLSYLTENITNKGIFLYKKENMVRWEYTSPVKYIIALRKDKFFIKDGKNVSSFDIKSNKLFTELNDVILGCIKGDILKNENNFKFSFFENNSIYLVKLTPVAPKIKEIFKMIEIGFNKTNFDLTELKMTENTGDFTKIQFVNRKYNINISDEKFNIK